MRFKDFSVLDRCLLVATVAGMVLTLVMPNTGELALLDVLGGCVCLSVAGIIALRTLISVWKTGKWRMRIGLLILTVVLLACGTKCTADLILDTVQGSQIIHLEDCTVGKDYGKKGRVTGYELTGYDETGSYHRIEISAEDYSQLKNKYILLRSGITLRGYLHTGRAVWVM
jgi:hypothetical protein